MAYNTNTGLLLQQSGTIVRRSRPGSQYGTHNPNDFPSLQALYTAQLRYLLSTENGKTQSLFREVTQKVVQPLSICNLEASNTLRSSYGTTEM